MIYAQFFFTLYCMVSFCLGLNIIMEEGQLLYFLRKPFEGLHDEINNKKSLLRHMTDLDELSEMEAHIFKLKLKHYLTKPLFTCITCFASVWGASVFISLNGINEALLPYLIISCVSSAFIQTAIYVKVSI